MALRLEELTHATRQSMLAELEAEQSTTPHFIPTLLSPTGRARWPELLRIAIETGDDLTLARQLEAEVEIFRPLDARGARVNIAQASSRLATSEFNTWYVRGLSLSLLDEGVALVEVYRAADPKWAPAECSAHEGVTVSTQTVYSGHRARYWPTVDNEAFSIPFQPGCHHSIRRLP